MTGELPAVTRLANGVQVVVVPRDDVDVVTVAIAVAVGSRGEPSDRTGFAHLFEHVMFSTLDGAPGSGPGSGPDAGRGEYARRIRAVGGRFNGSTRSDCTVFHVTAPAEACAAVLRTEAARFGAPVFTQAALDREVGVVTNEIAERVGRRSFGRFPMTELRELMFSRLPNRRDGAASVHGLPAATLHEVHDFFERQYAPERLTVCVVGGVDAGSTLALIDELFSPIPARPAAPLPPLDEPFTRHPQASAAAPAVAPAAESTPVADASPLAVPAAEPALVPVVATAAGPDPVPAHAPPVRMFRPGLPAEAAAVAYRVPDPADPAAYLPVLVLAEVVQERAARHPLDALVSFSAGVDLMGDPLGVRDPTALVLRGLVDAGAGVDAASRAGAGVDAAFGAGAGVDAALHALEQAIARAAPAGTHPVTESEVAAAGAVLAARFASSLDDPAAHATALATRVAAGLAGGSSDPAAFDLRTIGRRLGAMTADDVGRAVDALSAPVRLTLQHEPPSDPRQETERDLATAETEEAS